MSQAITLAVTASDGHRFDLLHLPAHGRARAHLLWLPALGVSARHYLPFAHELAALGCSVSLHEWRGHGSSTLRAARQQDWGFAQLLHHDLPASIARLEAEGITVDTLGGHSLGGQLGSCLAGQVAGLKRLWLVASGSPHWRNFPAPHRYTLPLAYCALPAIAALTGYLPGRQLGFGGREARGVIADWARVGRQGHYRIPASAEAQMQALQLDCTAIVLQHDWLAPPASLQALLAKLPNSTSRTVGLDALQLGTRADHFAWMQHPCAVARALMPIFP